VDSTSFDSLDEDAIIHLKFNNLINLLALSIKHLIKLLGLSHCSWESIKQHAFLALWLVHRVLDQSKHYVITNESTLGNNIFDLESHRRTARNVVSDQVTCGTMANAELIADNWTLCTLSSAWWTNHNNVHVWHLHAFGSSLHLGK
jgi:hypothetical protein